MFSMISRIFNLNTNQDQPNKLEEINFDETDINIISTTIENSAVESLSSHANLSKTQNDHHSLNLNSLQTVLDNENSDENDTLYPKEDVIALILDKKSIHCHGFDINTMLNLLKLIIENTEFDQVIVIASNKSIKQFIDKDQLIGKEYKAMSDELSRLVYVSFTKSEELLTLKKNQGSTFLIVLYVPLLQSGKCYVVMRNLLQDIRQNNLQHILINYQDSKMENTGLINMTYEKGKFIRSNNILFSCS